MFILSQEQKTKKVSIIVICLAFLLLVGCSSQKNNQNISQNTLSKIEGIREKSIPEVDSRQTVVRQELPESANINVPFSPQAPFANWDPDHNEACEEASILLAQEFIKGNNEKNLDKDYADSEIIKMIAWQRANWGGHFDLDIGQTKDLAQLYYGLENLRLAAIDSVDDLKEYLADGKIIIAPTAGRELGNPHFTQPGPVYHMLVITGYDGENFITNDVGIRQGRDWEYQYDVLFNAIRDLPEEAKNKEHFIKNHPELIGQGEKRVLIVSR